jgi:hypothetical protein
MSIGKLILYPADPSAPPPATGALIRSLQQLGLMGQPMDTEPGGFLAGDRFLQLISFVGCSTDVCLTPQADPGCDFCHLTIHGPLPQPQLMYDNSCHPPRCPDCKTPISDWKERFDGASIKCGDCDTEIPAGAINWGKYAGFSRLFIEIHNIFPGEAIPVGLLFDRLQQDTGVTWKYFFTGRG